MLPNWRKISLNCGRDLSDQCIESQLSVLTLELKSLEARKLIVKLRASNNHNANMKILNSVDVSRVKSVLEDLGGNPEGLTKEGVCLAILREVLRRLPHKCVDCDQVVTHDSSAPVSSQCIAYKTQLCTNCYQGDYKNVTCSPWSSWIMERYTILKELYTKHHQKKIGS